MLAWIKTTVGKEGADIGYLRNMIVHCKLCQGEPLVPVVLLVVDIAPEVLFYYRVDPFSQAICLWMIGS